MREKFHITPQARIVKCQKSFKECTYRKQDHFSSYEKAQQVLQVRKTIFTKTSLPKTAVKVTPALKKELIASAKTSHTLSEYIAVGREIIDHAFAISPLRTTTVTSLYEIEELQYCLQATFSQLYPSSDLLVFQQKRGLKTFSMDYLPNRIKTPLSKEQVQFENAKKVDYRLHGRHTKGEYTFSPFVLSHDALAENFLLHQVTHLIQSKLPWTLEEVFYHWTQGKKYSTQTETAVWYGFPLDGMGVSPEELLPVLTEALFAPLGINYRRVYTEQLHESIYFAAGFWLALGWKPLARFDKITL